MRALPVMHRSATSPDRSGVFQLDPSVVIVCFALCFAQCVYLLASLIQGSWVIDVNGQLIATDFVNVWASGRQALDGNAAAAYDVAIHKQAEVAALGHPFPGQYPWIYPPTFFLVAAPLALIPFIAAYAAWMALAFSAYVAAMRAIVGERAGLLLACAFPGILSNLVVGQNGFLTAALLGGSLLLMERGPVLAGCLVGLLSFKPHLGVLFPFVLVAGRHWRVLAAAAVTTALLVVASAWVPGLEAWQAFLQSLPLASEATLTQGRADWAKLQSVYALTRLLGGSAALAWCLQLALSGVVIILLCLIWRRKMSFELKAAALATGSLLVTPYLFLYDLVVLAVPMAFLIRAARCSGEFRGEMPVIGLASLLILIFPLVMAPLGLAAILLVAVLIVRRTWQGPDPTCRVRKGAKTPAVI
jgi:arabinofuranan 3-O-arabinosyltransferase